MRRNTAKLRFGPASSLYGFSSKVIAADNDVVPHVVVRELVQNALDAAEQRTGGAGPAHVEFNIRRVPRADIPGIQDLRKAFESACVTYGGGGGGGGSVSPTAKAQIEGIRNALAEKTTPILEVRDNGVGLDRRRMNRLLGEGLTDKTGPQGGQSAGSYGLGHYTAFGATDLQYVLYGGVTANGATTMSAHAVLASHMADGKTRDPHGHYVKSAGWMSGGGADPNSWYEFPHGEEIPPFFQNILKDIKKRSGSGSAVVIPAFNDFREDGINTFGDRADCILGAVAVHFFPAIHFGRLRVTVAEDGETRTLSADDLGRFLKSAGGRDGKSAHAGHRALTEGEKETITTTHGDVNFHYRLTDVQERTQLAIFRNGMFIVRGSKLPVQLRRFDQYKPFVGLLCFDPSVECDAGQDASIYGMLRGSEGEKHLGITPKRLENAQRNLFNKCMREIEDGIGRIVGKEKRDDFWSDITFPGMDAHAGKGKNRPAPPGKRTASQTNFGDTSMDVVDTPDHDEIDEEGEHSGSGDGPPKPEPPDGPAPPRPPKPEFDRKAPKHRMRPVMRVVDQSTIRVTIMSEEDVPRARLRLMRHSGADSSCDAGLAHDYVKFSTSGANQARETEVGALAAGERRTFELVLQEGCDAREGAFVPVLVTAPEPGPPESAGLKEGSHG